MYAFFFGCLFKCILLSDIGKPESMIVSEVRESYWDAGLYCYN